MADTAYIVCTLEALLQGGPIRGRHGDLASSVLTPLSISSLTEAHVRTGKVPIDAVELLYDSSADLPATWSTMFFRADQACQLQIIAGSTNVILQVLANLPYILGHGSILPAADGSDVSAGGETLTAISKINITGLTGGTAANYQLILLSPDTTS